MASPEDFSLELALHSISFHSVCQVHAHGVRKRVPTKFVQEVKVGDLGAMSERYISVGIYQFMTYVYIVIQDIHHLSTIHGCSSIYCLFQG